MAETQEQQLEEPQGAMREALKGADVPPGDIDLIESVEEAHPGLKKLDLRGVAVNPQLRKNLLPALRNEELVGNLEQTLAADNSLIGKINYLIAREPQKLVDIAPDIEAEPGRLLRLAQATEVPPLAKTGEKPDAEGIGDFLDRLDFRDQIKGFQQMFQSGDFSFGNIMENLFKMLNSMFTGIYGFTVPLAVGGIKMAEEYGPDVVDGVKKLKGYLDEGMDMTKGAYEKAAETLEKLNTDELVVAGNGTGGVRPDGPLAQAQELSGRAFANDPVVHIETPEGIVTGRISQVGVKPDAAPKADQPAVSMAEKYALE